MITEARSKPGPVPGLYRWKGRDFIGIQAVATAAGVNTGTVSYHLNSHGNLDRLGMGPHAFGGGKGTPRRNGRKVEKFGRVWASMSRLARDAGRSLSTVKGWIDAGDDDRLLAALMAAEIKAQSEVALL